MIVRKDGETLDVAESEIEKFEKLGWEKAEVKGTVQDGERVLFPHLDLEVGEVAGVAGVAEVAEVPTKKK